MEDQKKRLSEYCQATGLHFAVYNGDTPEYHEDGRNEPLPNEITTRDLIRDTKNEGTRPEILLTNPSMLEYILVRQKDQQMLQESAGRLRWIIIDEAHSYSGSAAVELAYQIKRILDAFGKMQAMFVLLAHLLLLVEKMVHNLLQSLYPQLQGNLLSKLRLSEESVLFVLLIWMH